MLLVKFILILLLSSITSLPKLIQSHVSIQITGKLRGNCQDFVILLSKSQKFLLMQETELENI